MTTANNQELVVSRITAYDQEQILACDGQCQKAWGVSSRPTIQFDEADPDDIAFLADDEIGIAPKDPGTEEGSDRKPLSPVHNKWCLRECERSASCEVSKFPSELKLPDLSDRIYNQPWKH